MATALPVNSQLRYKRQSAKGTLAGATLGQILRRTTAMFNLQKENYDTSAEIVSHQQLVSNRHGNRLVNGSINDILSAGTFSDMISAILRRDYAAVTASTGVGVTIAGTGPTYTLTRSAGSFLTDGYKIGMVVRLSVGTLNAANINKNLLIIALTATVATVMTVNGSALVAEGPITGCTVTAVGKVTFTPATGHTNIYYTIETWDPDVPSSERNIDCKVGKIDVKLPGSGNSQIDISMLGLDQQTATTAYYTSPSAETTTGALIASSGLLLVNGAAVATITDLSISIDGGEKEADGVVGSVIRPDIFRNIVKITGSFTAYFDSRTLADNFMNETSAALVGVFAADTSATADFISVFIPMLDTTSADSDDGVGKGKKRTYNFIAEFNSAGGAALATPQTTMQIQDSAA